MKDSSDSEQTASKKIAIRNNWLKIFVVVVATVVFSIKIWQADFSNAIDAMNFSDLLALTLALFSIALAVLFYMKATDTSNVFYDNTYRFTRDVSEILGRVEAGFGEKLAHLDEGYSGLKTAVEKIPFDRKQAEKDIEEEEQQVHKVEQERTELIESLATRARIEGEEKERLFEQLKLQDKELSNARRDVTILRQQMTVADRESEVPSIGLRHYLRSKVFSDRRLSDLSADDPTNVVFENFKIVIMDNTSDRFRRELRRQGYVTDDLDPTTKGVNLIYKFLADKDA